MKHDPDPDQTAGPRLIPVRFEVTPPTPVTVRVAGSFDHWQPASWWQITALAPDTYEYCLMVEGQWTPTD